MTTFTFTDNSGRRKHVVTLTAEQMALHLAKDQQFVFYWRKGWDPRLAANRSLYTNPPDLKAPVCPDITEDQWPEIAEHLDRNKMA